MTGAMAWILLAAVGLPTLVVAVELVAAHWPRRLPAASGSPRTALLVPAHDEGVDIAGTVRALRAAAPAGSRILVVADNCTDDSAEQARRAGAETIERRDPARRGKGFALDFGRDRLAADPPDVVIVLDADCAIDRDGLARLAAAAHIIGRPVQSAYLLRPRPELGALVALSGFAFLLRNLVRQRGLARLGAPALLTGSGMAFPWACFAAAPLASADVVEDLTIGIALARMGMDPVFLAEAVTLSDPARRAATLPQRRRWEHGFLRTAWREAPSLIAAGRWPLAWLGLHLAVPPLALLVLIDLFALALLDRNSPPFALLAALLALLALLLLLGWARFGRAQLPARQLMLIPLYMVWKLPLYAAAMLRPERSWTRTDRGRDGGDV